MKSFFHSYWVHFQSLGRPAKLFLLALMLDGLLISGWGLFFNLYIIEAGFNREFLGMINALPSLAGLIFGVPMGLLSDRIGRKRGMLIGFFVANLAMAAQAALHQGTALLTLSFIAGMTSQLYVLSQAPFMMRVSDEKNRDLLFSLSFGIFPFASTLGNILAGQLPGLFDRLFGLQSGSVISYQAVLLFSVISSFAVLIPLAFINEPAKKIAEQVHARPEVPKRSVWSTLKQPLTIKLILPNLITGLGAATFVPYMNVFFTERHHLSNQALGFLFSAASLLVGLASFSAPRLVGNLGGKIRTIVLVQSSSLVFLVMLGFSPLAWLAIIGFLVRGMLMNMVSPLWDAFAMEQVAESEQGAVNSLRALCWNVGWSVGPFISGVVQQRYGFSPLFVSTTVLYAIAIALIWVFFGQKRNPAGQDPMAATNLG